MRASVPAAAAHNEYVAFPKGFYDGRIEAAEIRDPNGDGEWLTLKIAVADVTPKEGTEDPGRSRFNSDITIQTDGVNTLEVEYSGDLPFQIRKAQELLAGLAEGLGVAELENGSIYFDTEALVNALVEGDFEGEAVGFEVSHWTPKNADSARDQYNQFGPAS